MIFGLQQIYMNGLNDEKIFSRPPLSFMIKRTVGTLVDKPAEIMVSLEEEAYLDKRKITCTRHELPDGHHVHP